MTHDQRAGWQSAAPRPRPGTVQCGSAAKCQRGRLWRMQRAPPGSAAAPRVELAGAPPRREGAAVGALAP
eukprot:271910-Alexandrium_andersonii.AAC.1